MESKKETGHLLSAKTISQISLIQSMVGHLPDNASIFPFVCRGLHEVPGVTRVTYNMDDKASLADTFDEEIPELLQSFIIKSDQYIHGVLTIFIADTASFSPYIPYIKNLANMLAVIFEERRQKQLNLALLADLERRVHERTKALELEIKERKNAQQALQTEKEKVELYLEIVEVILVVLDDQARIVLLNRKGYEVLGYDPGELEGKNWFQVCLPPEDVNSVFSVYKEILTGENEPLKYIENFILTKKGDKRYIAWHNKILKGEQGQIIGTLSSGEDITDRRKAEENLRQSEENLRITLHSIGDAVISTDTDGKITRINPVAEALTGWKRKDAWGRPLPEVFHIVDEHTRNPVKNPVEKILKTGAIVGLANHTLLISRDGAEYRIADSGAPIRDANNVIAGVVLVFRDVTEQYRAEQEMLKMEKLESVGILAGGIAHDFNNLLTGVFGNLEMAKMSLPADHKAYPFLEFAEQSMDHAIHLTNQLLTFAKGGEPIKEPVSLSRIITETAKFCLRGSKSKLDLRMAPDLWMIEADKGQLGQVISNLVINAEQAMPTGGLLEITAKNIEDANGRFVQITIRDEGLGIPTRYVNKIFDPFFSTKQKGSGLGLATTHSIIAKHAGKISVDSKMNQGTVFTVYLPATDIPEETPDEASSSQSNNTPVSAVRVLVMDDEPLIRDVVGEMLAQMGCEADFASEGREAIRKYRTAYENGRPYEVVITDLTIPGGMGGKEAAQEILRTDPEAKIIISSGYATDPVMSNYKAHGFKGVAVKPFRFSDLRRIVQEVLAPL